MAPKPPIIPGGYSPPPLPETGVLRWLQEWWACPVHSQHVTKEAAEGCRAPRWHYAPGNRQRGVCGSVSRLAKNPKEVTCWICSRWIKRRGLV